MTKYVQCECHIDVTYNLDVTYDLYITHVECHIVSFTGLFCKETYNGKYVQSECHIDVTYTHIFCHAVWYLHGITYNEEVIHVK